MGTVFIALARIIGYWLGVVALRTIALHSLWWFGSKSTNMNKNVLCSNGRECNYNACHAIRLPPLAASLPTKIQRVPELVAL